MKVIKSEHITNTQPLNRDRIENRDSRKFLDILSDYMDKRVDLPAEENKSDQKVTLNSYNGFSDLKINHIEGDEKNSYIVKSIINKDEIERREKLELIRKRLDKGFYSRDDIIMETAGKILDEVDLDL